MMCSVSFVPSGWTTSTGVVVAGRAWAERGKSRQSNKKTTLFRMGFLPSLVCMTLRLLLGMALSRVALAGKKGPDCLARCGQGGQDVGSGLPARES